MADTTQGAPAPSAPTIDIGDIKQRAFELRRMLSAILSLTSDPAVAALARECSAVSNELINEVGV